MLGWRCPVGGLVLYKEMCIFQLFKACVHDFYGDISTGQSANDTSHACPHELCSSDCPDECWDGAVLWADLYCTRKCAFFSSSKLVYTISMAIFPRVKVQTTRPMHVLMSSVHRTAQMNAGMALSCG